MRVQILPVVDQSGIKYRVARRRFMGRLLLDEHDNWESENCRYRGIFWHPATFATPMRAAAKIRELYGTSAIIEQWTG